MLLAVDDDGSYLLVHEDKDGAEKSRNRCSQDCPPWVASYWIDQPTSIISGWLEEHITEESGHDSTTTLYIFISKFRL